MHIRLCIKNVSAEDLKFACCRGTTLGVVSPFWYKSRSGTDLSQRIKDAPSCTKCSVTCGKKLLLTHDPFQLGAHAQGRGHGGEARHEPGPCAPLLPDAVRSAAVAAETMDPGPDPRHQHHRPGCHRGRRRRRPNKGPSESASGRGNGGPNPPWEGEQRSDPTTVGGLVVEGQRERWWRRAWRDSKGGGALFQSTSPAPAPAASSRSPSSSSP